MKGEVTFSEFCSSFEREKVQRAGHKLLHCSVLTRGVPSLLCAVVIGHHRARGHHHADTAVSRGQRCVDSAYSALSLRWGHIWPCNSLTQYPKLGIHMLFSEYTTIITVNIVVVLVQKNNKQPQVSYLRNSSALSVPLYTSWKLASKLGRRIFSDCLVDNPIDL